MGVHTSVAVMRRPTSTSASLVLPVSSSLFLARDRETAGAWSSKGNMTALLATLPHSSVAESVTVDLPHAGTMSVAGLMGAKGTSPWHSSCACVFVVKKAATSARLLKHRGELYAGVIISGGKASSKHSSTCRM